MRRLLKIITFSTMLLVLSALFASDVKAAQFLTSPLPTATVNSWFDHDGEFNCSFDDPPSCDGTFIKYNGDTWTGGSADRSSCTYGLNCYEGHNGIDFQASTGTDVYATSKGSVTSGYSSSLGNWVKVWNSQYDRASFYAHLDSILVSSGDVRRGKHIAESGCTGTGCMGPHLHFEVRDASGDQRDPYGWSGEGSDPHSPASTNLWLGGTPKTPTFYNSEYRVYFTGSDGNVWYQGFDGALWTDWAYDDYGKPSGGFTYQPSAEVLAGKIHLFARGSNGKFYYNIATYSGGWSGWSLITPCQNVAFLGAPKAVEWNDKMWVFGQGTDHKIYRTNIDAAGEWTPGGCPAFGNPVSGVDVASDPMVRAYYGPGTDYLIVSVTSNDTGGSTYDGKVYAIKHNGSSWDASWTYLNGPGPSSKVYNWSGGGRVWTDMLGAAYQNTDNPDKQYYIVFAQGSDQELYRRHYINGSWYANWSYGDTGDILDNTDVAYAPNAEGFGSGANELWALTRELSNNQLIIRGRGDGWYGVCTALNSTLFEDANGGTVPWAESVNSEYGTDKDRIWVAFRDANKNLKFVDYKYGTGGVCDGNGWSWYDNNPNAHDPSISGVTLESDPWALDW